VTGSHLPILAGVVPVALLVVGAAAGIVHMVRTRRPTEAGTDALETATRSSIGQLRSMSFTELTDLNKRLAGLSASVSLQSQSRFAHAKHSVATALYTKRPGA
jgi:hypothetical protein